MRLITPPATPASLPDLIAQFNAEIIQGHREALQALREIMAEAAFLPTPASETDPAENTPQTRAIANAATRRLSLRLRAATAILRVKLIKDAESALTAQRAHPHSPAQLGRADRAKHEKPEHKASDPNDCFTPPEAPRGRVRLPFEPSEHTQSDVDTPRHDEAAEPATPAPADI